MKSSPAALATALTASDDRPWEVAPHFALLNGAFLDLAADVYDGLIVCMPPQNGKSTFISHWGIAWYLAAFPYKRVVFASYEADYASEWCTRVRDTIRDNPAVFGMRLVSATRKKFTIAKYGGGMKSTGVGGPLTGSSADLLVIDDPIKNAEQANSAVYRESCDLWFRSVAVPRLSPTGKIIIVVTRWHHDDLVGRIKKRMEEGGRKYHVIELPAVAEEGREDALGRTPGTPLWPKRYPLEWLNQQKIDSGPYYWTAQYQQRPTSSTTQIIKPEWWRFYRWDPDGSTLPAPRLVLQAWDTAFKDREQNDYSVHGTWFLTDNGFYLVDFSRERLTFPRLKTETVARAARWSPNIIIVEDKASGQSLIQEMRAETRLPIRGVEPIADKTMRLHQQSGYWEAGKVHIPDNAPWTRDILDEFEQFPKAPHDDIVDMFTLAIGELRKRDRSSRSHSHPQSAQQQSSPNGKRPQRRQSTFLKGFQ